MRYCLIVCLFIGSLSLGQSIDLPDMQVVDPNVAIFAAFTYAPTFYPGKWGFYERQECYNIDGTLSAHIIIFKNIEIIVDTPKMLSNSLSKSFKEIKEYETKVLPFSNLEDVQTTHQMIRERYHTKEYTTIITGSTSYSPVIIRWMPGLPEFMVKKNRIQEWLKETCPESSFILRKLIYINPRDIRYEVVSSIGEIYVVDFSKRELSMLSLEQIKKDISQQPLPIPKDLPESKKRIIEDGIKVQKLRNIQLWQNYETLYKKTKVEE